MEMRAEEVDGVWRVRLAGRLDTMGVSRGETRFASTVGQAGRRVVVDLSEVSFLASLGVRMFISSGRVSALKGGRLVLFGAQPAVTEIIETTALNELVPVAASEDEAVALARG